MWGEWVWREFCTVMLLQKHLVWSTFQQIPIWYRMKVETLISLHFIWEQNWKNIFYGLQKRLILIIWMLFVMGPLRLFLNLMLLSCMSLGICPFLLAYLIWLNVKFMIVLWSIFEDFVVIYSLSLLILYTCLFLYT